MAEKKTDPVYVTEISDKRWWYYDIPGNLGWILYLVFLIMTLVGRPAFLRVRGYNWLMGLAVIPAVLILIGIGELISERIRKLDRELPRSRLIRGFGSLTCGGLSGMFVTLAGLIHGFHTTQGVDFTNLAMMFFGSVLLAVFSWLLFRSFHLKKPQDDAKEGKTGNDRGL